MSPFNHQETSKESPKHIYLILILVALAGIFFWLIPNKVDKTYSQYQAALSAYDMKAVLEQSDKGTRLFAQNLLGWVLRGEDASIRKMSPLEQNLIWAARCQAILDKSPIVDEYDLMAAWTSRFKLAYRLPQTELRNSYTAKNEAQAQIFDKQTRILTDIKVFFYKEDSWKVDTIALIQDLIDQEEGSTTHHQCRLLCRWLSG